MHTVRNFDVFSYIDFTRLRREGLGAWLVKVISPDPVDDQY